MPPNPVIRRYTPPTCTLEIVDRNSPLSRWVGRSVTSLSQFDLRFDDPRLPEEKRFNIQGDQEQLTALHEAVNTYVQDLLSQSPEQFNLLIEKQANLSSQTVSPSPRAVDSIPPDPLDPSEAPQVDPLPSANVNGEDIGYDTAPTSAAIFLEPGRRLSHNLFLGPLANNQTGQVVQLSMLQLFDLSTALDEYAADVVTLPPLKRSRSSRYSAVTPSTAWASIAAILLLGVGLTTVGVQLFNRSNSRPQVAINNRNQQQTALQPSPTPPLSSLETLPSLPPANPNLPPPNNNLPPLSVPGTAPPIQGTLPVPPPQSTTITPNALSTPSTPTTQTTPVDPILRSTAPSTIVINPTPGQAGSVTRQTAVPGVSGVTTLPGITPPADVPRPQPQNNPPSPNTLPVPPAATRSVPPAESGEAPTAQQRLNAAIQKRSPNTPTTPSEPKTTAYAPTAQVTEARDFFSQRWEPPSGLKQTLEYSILLDVDGTIQRIEPLGQAARTYVDRSGMPLIGERFVSPSPSGQTPRIRVVLNPNGKVQAFLESMEKENSPNSANPANPTN